MSPAPRRAAGRKGAAAKATGTAGTPQLLHELLSARGPSGREAAPAAVWRQAAGAFAEVSTDLLGTPLALVAPRPRGWPTSAAPAGDGAHR
ncbi:MAG: hypothetical protein ACYDC2_03495 [Solirubrobacteraceae bacterium]